VVAVVAVVVATASLIHKRLHQVIKGRAGKGGTKDKVGGSAASSSGVGGKGGKVGKHRVVDGLTVMVTEEPRCKQQWKQQVSATSSLHVMCQCVRRWMSVFSDFVASCYLW
jgi:hypothetical protein